MPDRVVLITGAASGIGAATARRFGDRGAKLAVVDVNAHGLGETAAAIEKTGGSVLTVVADVTASGAAQAAVSATIERFGRLDVFVNAAGITRRNAISDTSDEEWQKVIDVNLTAPFRWSRAAISALRDSGGGAIVIVASVWGLVAGPKVVAYAAAKGGLVNLTRAMAIDHGPDRIRVNAVCPGDIDTPLMREEARLVGLDPDRAVAESGAGRPVGRVGVPDDVTSAIEYLASPEAGYITGTTLTIDGGWMAGG
jgi:NAD(P)-dependent dehydrogenase (short-subunit alcohol dehydrogenase family)